MQGYALAYFFPVHRIEVQTSLSPAEVAARLDDATRWKNNFLTPGDFSGDISADRFRLVPDFLRLGKRATPYEPRLRGTIVALSSGGTRVAITLVPYWLGVAGIAVILLIGFARSDPASGWITLGVAVLAHILWCAMGFVPSAKRVEERLQDLLAAT